MRHVYAGHKDRRIARRTDRMTDRWRNGRMEGRTDRRVYTIIRPVKIGTGVSKRKEMKKKLVIKGQQVLLGYRPSRFICIFVCLIIFAI